MSLSPQYKRSSIKKITKKGQQTVKKDNAFYQEIWGKRPHFCEECGSPLGNMLKKIYFAHVVSKGSYPGLRHVEENIVLLCDKHHIQLDCNDKTKMRIWPRLEKLIIKLKRMYYDQRRKLL